jgi:periplasmic glucans biosynthesis protein
MVGYAGFRIHYPINKPDVLDEVVVFLGASYFRAVPKDMTYGLIARGLALDTAVEKREEEFPAFTKFWLRRPERFAKRMTIYAMLEGRNVTGVYQFTVEPGVETRMHVRAVLFFRKKAEHAGYAPMTSMYWFGENTSNTLGDFRPEVHDSDGLLIQRSNGEWLWHPLAWSRQLFWSGFNLSCSCSSYDNGNARHRIQQIATGFWLVIYGFLTTLLGGDTAQIAHSLDEEPPGHETPSAHSRERRM